MDISLPCQDDALFLSASGQIDSNYRWDRARPTAILPGSFNPVHAGHWGLAAVAAELLGRPVAFELSIANVEKTTLARDEVERRRAQFTGRAPLWLTHAPLFGQKARLFPGAVFVIGADTAIRIVAPRFYQHDPQQMEQALHRLREHGCRFLVACRVDSAGRCLTLADIALPLTVRDLFEAIPPERFRFDICSTEVRARSIEFPG